MNLFIMEAKENYDPARVAEIAAATQPTTSSTDQNYQGYQFDAVRRNLMYVYVFATVDYESGDTLTNDTGFTLWDGQTTIAPADAYDPTLNFNTFVCSKNIDSGLVTFYTTYDPNSMVPSGIGGSDGTYRRYTHDFLSEEPSSQQNGLGMTDPYTGAYWIGAQSCELYCFRIEDAYAMTISPVQPVLDPTNNMQPVGFTDTGATSPWTIAREVDQNADTGIVNYYYIPRLRTAAEITADYLLIYATYAFPLSTTANSGTVPVDYFQTYWREAFDTLGNVFVFGCAATGAKDFTLYMLAPPTSAPAGGPQVGGGFTDVTPWGSGGPNGDAAGYTLKRGRDNPTQKFSDIIVISLPLTNDLACISKFYPAEHTSSSSDPALMFWSCTYVRAPAGTPTWTHFSAFVTGYMTAAWAPAGSLANAGYVVIDAFELNNYLDRSDYAYDQDYTLRWFFFICNLVTAGVSDGINRSVLVQYRFAYGAAPVAVQVVDEAGWNANYPAYADAIAAVQPSDGSSVIFNSLNDSFNLLNNAMELCDTGVFDPVTDSFWWSGGGQSASGSQPSLFPLLNDAFADRIGSTPWGQDAIVTPPFMRLSFGSGPPPGVTDPGTWLMERMDNRIWASVEDAYAVDSGVSNPMASPAANLTASTSDPGAVTFTADAAVFSSANVGDVIRMGAGIATVGAYVDAQTVTGAWVLPGDPWSTGDPYSPSGDWTIATPVSALYAPHLTGRDDLVGLADGVPIGPLSATGQFGFIPLPFPASNVKVGLGFTAQMQTAYLNGPQVAQGARKVIPAVTVRLAASGPFEFGTNQPDGGAQNPQQLAPEWTNMTPANLLAPTGGQSPPPIWTSPGGQPVVGTFTGDLRVVGTGGAWISKGQVAVQQTLPMALEVTSIEPETLEGDAPEQTYQQQGGPGGGQNQQQPRPPGRHMLSGPPRI